MRIEMANVLFRRPRCSDVLKFWPQAVGTPFLWQCREPRRLASAVLSFVRAWNTRNVSGHKCAGEIPYRCSQQTRKISFEHPPGPGEKPDGALLKHFAKRSASTLKSRVGANSRTSHGISLICGSGLLLLNSRRVLLSLGARNAPVNSCRALDTCPCCTRLSTACLLINLLRSP